MKAISIFFFLFFSLTLNAQIQPELAKEKATQLIEKFESLLNIISNPTSTLSEKKSAKKQLRPLFISSSTYVYNDLTGKTDTAVLKMFTYLKEFEAAGVHGATTQFNYPKLTITGIYVNEARNSYQIKANVKRRIDITKIDTLAQGDSLRFDTTMVKKLSDLDFYIHVKEEYGKYTDFVIEAIAANGTPPKYVKKLSKNAQYWVSLDPSWKAIFSERFKFPEVPNDYRLDYIQNVDKLDFTGQQVNDFSPLLGLRGLKELYLDKSNFADISLLRNLHKLQILEISHTQVRNLTGIENLSALEVFSCSNNELDSVGNLGQLTTLLELDLSANQIEDLSSLSALINLEDLYLGSNLLFDLSFLKNMNKLEKLDLSKNIELDNIDVLKNKYSLVELYIYNTKTVSLTPLTNLKRIIYLNVGYTKITSLDPIKGLVYLKRLNIQGNKIDDFSALNGFSLIQNLNVATTNISDIGPLMKMKMIQELKANHTKFTKADIQRFKKSYPKCRITYY